MPGACSSAWRDRIQQKGEELLPSGAKAGEGGKGNGATSMVLQSAVLWPYLQRDGAAAEATRHRQECEGMQRGPCPKELTALPSRRSLPSYLGRACQQQARSALLLSSGGGRRGRGAFRAEGGTRMAASHICSRCPPDLHGLRGVSASQPKQSQAGGVCSWNFETMVIGSGEDLRDPPPSGAFMTLLASAALSCVPVSNSSEKATRRLRTSPHKGPTAAEIVSSNWG